MSIKVELPTELMVTRHPVMAAGEVDALREDRTKVEIKTPAVVPVEAFRWPKPCWCVLGSMIGA